MARRFGMGEDTVQAMFDSQMSSFKTTLIDLYRKKSKAIADRETMRFRYLTGMKAKFLNIVSDMYSSMFADKNSAGETLITKIVDYIKLNTAMINLDGTQISGWLAAPSRLGGRLNISYFSPSAHLISEPFYAAPSTNVLPAYKIWPGYFDKNAYTLDYYVNGNNVFGTTGQMSLAGIGGTGYVQFTMPPSLDWTKAFLKSQNAAGLIDQYDYMVAKFSKTYNSGNMATTLNDLLELFKSFIQQTKLVVQIQMAIDVSEKDLADFVSSYKGYIGTSTTAADIISTLQAEAEKADIQPPPVAIQAVSDAPAIETVVPPPPESKSKTPLLAAAAIGVFMLLNKGKS